MNPYRWMNESLESWGQGWWFSPTGPRVLQDRERYPKVWLHESVNGRGSPLLTFSNPAPMLDTGVLAQIARFNVWSVSPIDLYDSDRNVFTRVRQTNPKIKILAHVLGPKVWPAAMGGWAGRLWNALFPAVGGRFCETLDRGTWEQYARLDVPLVQNALVTAYLELLDSGCFDGLVLDGFAPSDTWIYALNPTLDLTPWGDLQHWDAAMTHGKQVIIERLRAARPGALLIGNGGPRALYSNAFNGWLRENFPEQNGRTWASNVSGPLGLISDQAYYTASPKLSALCLARPALDPQGMRFALGSSCMGSGALIVGPGDFNAAVPYASWWIPEYSLDRATGRPLEGPATPWLGSPVEPAKETWPGWWRREFVFGVVTVDTLKCDARFEVR